MNFLLGNLLLLAVSTSARSATLSQPAIELLQSMGLPSFSMNNIRKGEKIREDDSDIYYINIPPTSNFNAENDIFQQNEYNTQNKYNTPNDYGQNDYYEQNYYNSQSSDYNHQSSDYNPQSSDYKPQSNDYNPTSSDYNPMSSDYKQQSNDYNAQSNDYHENSLYGLEDYQEESSYPGIVGFEEVGGALDSHYGFETEKTTTEYPFHKIPIQFTNNGRPHQVYHWSRPIESISHKEFMNTKKTTTPKPTTTTSTTTTRPSTITTRTTTYTPVTVPSISTSWPPHPSKVTTKKPWASFIKQFSANGKPTGLYIYKSKPIVKTYKKYKHPAFRHFNY